jgi:hypothetical protein
VPAERDFATEFGISRASLRAACNHGSGCRQAWRGRIHRH